MKALLAKDAFLRYPDHNKPFHIYCDASDLQLGAVIMQDGAPVAYYTRKLNSAQRNYTVGEKELLSIVETLKEFRSMLYGCPDIHVYTDHKNNTFKKFSTQRVLRWRLYLEEYGVQLHYVKGSDNPIADAMSRLSFERQDSVQPLNPAVPSDSKSPQHSYFSVATDDDDLLDCFVNLPASEGVPFVLTYEQIAEAQNGDVLLEALRQKDPQQFVQQLLAPGVSVYCYIPEPNAPWKIYLPTDLLLPAIQWYHYALSHQGSSRLFDTMSTHLYHPVLKDGIEKFVSVCDTCQRHKNVLRGHGHTAAREAGTVPWRQVAVDLIGPWELDIGGNTVSFSALTVIDMVTNLVEVIRIDNKTSAHVARQFENTWLSRYPRPLQCIHDQGGEFTGYAFQQMLRDHGIHPSPISSKNPQANSICERMHQSVGNNLRALSTLVPPNGIDTATQLVDTALANTMFATRAALHGTLGTSPGALAFHRDMVLDIPVIADLELLRNRRQLKIDERLIRANRQRFSYDYHIGDDVLKLVYKPDKLEPRAHGPYPIEQVHTNGTVTIRLNPVTTERISIRRIKPYRQ
jgi:transposase InsO family protein